MNIRKLPFLQILSIAAVLLNNTDLSNAQCVAPNCWPGKFYKMDVIGQAGQTTAAGTFTGFGDQPSLNENGVVAFVGQIGAGNFEGVFEGTGSATPTWITSGFASSGRVFGRAVQINDSNMIVARDSLSGSPPPSLMRIWNGNSPGTWQLINQAPNSSFSSVFAQPSINYANQVVFSALNPGGKTLLATPNGAAFNTVLLSTPLRPQIEDTAGKIVVRAGSTTTSPIVLYPNNLSTPLTIADTTWFNSLGQSPGISRDGTIVAFAGDMNSAGATKWNTNIGPGIFLAVLQGGSLYQIIRVAGFSSALPGGGLGTKDIENLDAFPPPAGTNWDGVCDPGESCTPVAEIEDGILLQTPLLPQPHIYFKTFDPAFFPNSLEWQERIGVIHTDFGAAGIDGDTVVVAFLATPSQASYLGLFSANPGLWTIRVDIRVLPVNPLFPPLDANVHRPLPVIQTGDLLGSTNESVTGVEVYDPIARALTSDSGVPRLEVPGDHRLAFSVTTSTGGQKIIRGTHLDTDGDGLLDHWETYGIDFNGDGTMDLDLSKLDQTSGAVPPSPTHKDLFVEADWMIATGHTHQPDVNPFTGAPLAVSVKPTDRVKNAFANSSVKNPDTTTGVNLHILVDEGFNEVTPVIWGTTGTDSFDDLKLGTGPCGGGTGAHFGDYTDRASPNCLNIIGARRLVTRYVIFGHDYSLSNDPSKAKKSSGIAQIGGTDFTVTLSASNIASPPCALMRDFADFARCDASRWGSQFDDEWADGQAATFMHELGHTLGLYHGGGDVWANYKPNYLSVMNYSFQFNGSGLPTPSATHSSACVLDQNNQTVCRTNRPLDYSVVALPDLNLAKLSEALGIGGPAGESTLWYLPSTAPGKFESAWSLANGSIDWNYDGTISATPLPKPIDLTNSACGPYGPTKCAPLTFLSPILKGHEDWSTIGYSFLDSPSFALGVQLFANPVTPEIDLPLAITQSFAGTPPSTLSIQIAGTGQGTVLSNPSGLACTSDCVNYSAIAATLTLTANPSAGSFFAGWAGACSGTGSCIVNLSGAETSVTATFSTVSLVAVPNVVGQLQAAAASSIQAAGLTVGAVTTASSSTVPSGSVISESPSAGTQVNSGSSVNLVVSSGPAQVVVPNVVGQTQAAAASAIQSAGLTVGAVTTASSSTVPSGSVISESPAAGTQVNSGSSVNLVVSSGHAQAAVPNVVGQTQAAAASAIQSAGLTVGAVTTASSSTVPSGTVISESPTAGTTVNAGSPVNLVVSSGLAQPPIVLSFNALFGSQSYNLTTNSRNRLPWDITGFRVVFSKPIASGSAASLSGVSVTGIAGLGTNTLIWSTSPIAQGSFSLSLAGSGPNALLDASGNGLNSGAGATQALKVLWGDFNDDGAVNAADLVGVNNETIATYNIFADINGDGLVNTADVQAVRARIGTSLP